MTNLINNVPAPKMKGETQYLGRCLIFGHYDSRGGAFLIDNVNSIIEGMQTYNKMCGWETNHDAAFEDLQNGSNGWIEIVVVGDGQISGDLLYEYDGDFLLYRMESCWYSTHDKAWTEWRELPVAVLRTVTKEEKAKIKSFDKGGPEPTFSFRDDDSEEKKAAAKAYQDWMEKSQKQYTEFLNGLTVEIDGKYKRGVLQEEYRFVRWDCGEDACGLVYED